MLLETSRVSWGKDQLRLAKPMPPTVLRSKYLRGSVGVNPEKHYYLGVSRHARLWQVCSPFSIPASLWVSHAFVGSHICIMDGTAQSSWFNCIENAFQFQESIDYQESRIGFCPRGHSFSSYNHTGREALSKTWFHFCPSQGKMILQL